MKTTTLSESAAWLQNERLKDDLARLTELSNNQASACAWAKEEVARLTSQVRELTEDKEHHRIGAINAGGEADRVHAANELLRADLARLTEENERLTKVRDEFANRIYKEDGLLAENAKLRSKLNAAVDTLAGLPAAKDNEPCGGRCGDRDCDLTTTGERVGLPESSKPAEWMRKAAEAIEPRVTLGESSPLRVAMMAAIIEEHAPAAPGLASETMKGEDSLRAIEEILISDCGFRRGLSETARMAEKLARAARKEGA